MEKVVKKEKTPVDSFASHVKKRFQNELNKVGENKTALYAKARNELKKSGAPVVEKNRRHVPGTKLSEEEKKISAARKEQLEEYAKYASSEYKQLNELWKFYSSLKRYSTLAFGGDGKPKTASQIDAINKVKEKILKVEPKLKVANSDVVAARMSEILDTKNFGIIKDYKEHKKLQYRIGTKSKELLTKKFKEQVESIIKMLKDYKKEGKIDTEDLVYLFESYHSGAHNAKEVSLITSYPGFIKAAGKVHRYNQWSLEKALKTEREIGKKKVENMRINGKVGVPEIKDTFITFEKWEEQNGYTTELDDNSFTGSEELSRSIKQIFRDHSPVVNGTKKLLMSKDLANLLSSAVLYRVDAIAKGCSTYLQEDKVKTVKPAHLALALSV